ncbi:DEAD/DEAH box helicase family protein (plasmid) [Aquicoccus sp. G2-2]|uniref:DEAD/DEAH box helicase family protein n=1 Tax=Aquicoccus sp. G2-2 TaxID=3092120 RepID=UPI003673234B
MPLRQLPTVPTLNTSTDRLIVDFYEPALVAAQRYDRGVGYFTSNWLKLASTGMAVFAGNGGRARFVVSPHMSSEDWAALNQGDQAKTDQILYDHLETVVEDLPEALEVQTLSALAWMIADGLLDIRLALPRGDLDGDFHDKFGIFQENGGDSVAFHGSQNDSAKAFRNYESISVFYSWVDAREGLRVSEHQNRFEQLWNNRDPNVRVLNLPEAIRQRLVLFTDGAGRPYPKLPTKPLSDPKADKWSHQAEAMMKFIEAGNGVLEMATGTGKTRTALKIIGELQSRGEVDAIVVTMSGTDLLKQWHKTIIANTDLAVFCQFGRKKEASSYLTCRLPKVLLIARQQLQTVIPHLQDKDAERALLVCDEVHGMGSPSMVRDLTDQLSRFRYRLGLSATPEREYDQDGNAFIESEIGPVVFRFGLEKAIEKAILCSFDYTALNYTLSEEDRLVIRQIFKRHHAKRAAGEVSSDEALYRDIARVRKTTTEKIPPFEDFLQSNPELFKRCLIFVETAEFGRHVQQLLMRYRVPYHTYFEQDESQNLKRFAEGQLECLVSCHRLSEGIDIQSVQNIVLFASSRAKLETIQRLGRCLRTDPQNSSKRAHVLDFVDFSAQENESNENRSADIDRFQWFTKLSAITSDGGDIDEHA